MLQIECLQFKRKFLEKIPVIDPTILITTGEKIDPTPVK